MIYLLLFSADTKSTSDIHLAENDCGRFHSYFNTVKIENSPSIMLEGMEDSVLGVWCSHGEGREMII
jgi:phosphoribosylformylglycinamidine synthase